MGIRIQPRDLEVPEEAPFQHDRLDRETPARVLTQIVASVEGPCVVSIDGPFGAGKSTFLRLWIQHLKNKGFPAARLNAWETDYGGDPFPALVEGIRSELEPQDDGAIKDRLKTFRRAAGRVAMRTTPALIRLATLGIVDVGPEQAPRTRHALRRGRKGRNRPVPGPKEVAYRIPQGIVQPLRGRSPPHTIAPSSSASTSSTDAGLPMPSKCSSSRSTCSRWTTSSSPWRSTEASSRIR